MLIIATIFFPSVKKRSLPHGRHTWAKCSQQPAPTCPPRCLIWCIKTGPLLQCGSTCLALRTSAPWPCKAENRFTRGSIDMSWPVCIYRIQKLPRLLVASSDGFLYIYNVDPQDGGECVLVQKHRCVDGAGINTILTVTVNSWNSYDPKKVV